MMSDDSFYLLLLLPEKREKKLFFWMNYLNSEMLQWKDLINSEKLYGVKEVTNTLIVDVLAHSQHVMIQADLGFQGL